MKLRPPLKPLIYIYPPNEQIATIHEIYPPSEHTKLLEFLSVVCKENKIEITDVFISESDTMQNSYDSNGKEISLYYITYKPNKSYESELKKYNEELEKYNNNMEVYNIQLKEYEEELEAYNIEQAKDVLAAAKKRKAAAEKEIREIEKKLKK